LRTWYEPFLGKLPGGKLALATEETVSSQAPTSETSDPEDSDPGAEEMRSPLLEGFDLSNPQENYLRGKR
jgi:hypothetical protein